MLSIAPAHTFSELPWLADPHHGDEILRRGIQQAKKGQIEKALVNFEIALRNNPANAFAYYNQAWAFYEQKLNDKAAEAFSRAIHIKPDFVEAFNGRGVAYVEMGDLARALDDFRKVIGLNATYADAFNGRGVVYAKMGDPARAIGEFNEAIRLNPDHAKAFRNLGISYEQIGNAGFAITNYIEAIRLDPDDTETRSLLRAACFYLTKQVIEITGVTSYNALVSREKIDRDDLGEALSELERKFGKDALLNAVNRRSSVGTGVLDPDMVARGLLKQASAEAATTEPMHPGVLLKTLIEEKGLTVVEASALLGVTRQQIYNVFTAVSDVTAEMAWKFEKAFGTPAMDWLNMQSEYSLGEVRARGDVAKPKRIRRASRLVKQQP